MSFSATTLEEALSTLGEVLADRQQAAELAVVGGGSLLLLGLIQRPTKDLDVVALVLDGGYAQAQPLPEYLTVAVVDVARALGLPLDWLNPGPASLLDLGLPPGFGARVELRTFGALVVHVASRFDQICFKLYASVDQGPRSKHARDLALLQPKTDELRSAAAWCRSQDPSDGFAAELNRALAALGGLP